jgi:enamine deaminase RidA (YjgF/YER057c/UK114 family)
VIAGRGELVVVAGQVGIDASGNVIGPDDPEAQITQAFTNTKVALAAADASFFEVVKLGFFLTSLDVFPIVRKVRDQFVDTRQPPTSTLVQVAGLVRPELIFEVDALAIRS